MSEYQERIKQLQQQYLTDLPGFFQEIGEHYDDVSLSDWDSTKIKNLYQKIHNLTGSAGTLGQQPVSDAAKLIEESLRPILESGSAPDDEAWRDIGSKISNLPQLTRNYFLSEPKNLSEQKGLKNAHAEPTIYYLVDSNSQAESFSTVLRDEGFQVKEFPSQTSLLDALNRELCPDAFLLDISMSDYDDSSDLFLHDLREKTDSNIPAVVVSDIDTLEARLSAYRAGANRYLLKPIMPDELIELLNTLTDRTPEVPYRVLLVDDEALVLEATSIALQRAGIIVRAITEPRSVLVELEAFDPDVVVLDVYMPDISGPEVASVIREKENYQSRPILFLSSEADIDRQFALLQFGGDDFLVKPVNPAHLVSAVKARARRSRQTLEAQRRLRTTLYEREREHLTLNSHSLVSVSDSEGNIIEVNDLFCEVTGYKRSELLGNNHRILKSSHHSPAFYEEMWQTISQGHVWQGELCNKKKDGSIYWVRTTITPFIGENGKPYQYVSIRTDISDVKERELNQKRKNAIRITVAKAASELLSATEDALDSVITRALRLIGREMGVDRAYMFLVSDDDYISATHEWCAKGIQAQIQSFQNLPLEPVSWWWGQLRLGKQMLINDVSKLPQEARKEKVWFESLGIKAAAALPIVKSRRVMGVLGFAQTSFPREWPSSLAQLFTLFGGMIVSAMERAKSDRLAQVAEQRLRLGQKFANIGTWEWNIATGELFWTEQIAPLFGYPLGRFETSYENFINAVHPDDRQAVADAITSCVEHDAPYRIEHRVIWPDGTVRWLYERGSVKRDPDGNAISMLGVVQDIDQRKSFEQTLHTFRHVVNAAVDAVIVIDRLGTIELVNPATSTIFGHSESDLIGHNVSVLMPTTIGNQHDSYIKNYLSTKIKKTIDRQVEAVGKRKDGTEFPVEIAVSELNLEQGEFFVALLRDITERKRNEYELVQAREEADRANKAKSHFLSSMSHELRTPMNAILGFGQLLKYDESLSDDNQENVNEILKAGDHLLTLINEVLDLAKIESGRVNLTLEAVDIEPVIKECLTLVGDQALKRNIQIDVKIHEDSMVWADRVRFKQIVLNLLSNAIKYNHSAGRVTVDVDAIPSDQVRIRVSDTGPGITDDQLSDLFLPFNRLDAEGTDVEGTGIGLTITKRLVELMNGAIGVESDVGVGSTFWLDLPRYKAVQVDSMTPQRKEQAPNSSSTIEDGLKHSKLVLYVEDNPANLKLVTQLFGRLKNVKLITAHTASLGIELAQSRLPDLILLDINLPGMNGYQVLQLLKSDPTLYNTPVVAVTAKAMPQDIEHGRSAGFSAYLTKPLDFNNFFEVIDPLLKNEGG